MVEVGGIEVVGEVDDGPIVAGLDRIGNSLENIETQFKQTDPSIKSVNKSTSSLVKNLGILGTVGLGAITALATKSPVLASTFAKISVSSLKLSNTIGTQFRPVFEGVNSFLQDFNKTLLDHDSAVSLVTTGVGQSITDLGTIIAGEWNKVDSIIPKSAGAIAGIKLGARYGLFGMLLGAALGATAGDLAFGDITPEDETDVFAESLAKSEKTMKLIKDRPGLFETSFSLGGFITPAAALSGFQTGSQLVIDFFEFLVLQFSDKDKKLSTANGVPR